MVQSARPYTGVFPVAPTPFTATGELDLEGQRRVLDCMIDQGIDGICVLANYSEQFLLTDHERDTLTDLCLSHVAGRRPVIVTCSHFSTQIAAERGRKAAAAGARMLMLMPPYHGAGLRTDENGIFEHFARVADATSIPIMVQDAPLSGVHLSVPFLVRLAREIPLVRYFKIEVPGAAGKLRNLRQAGGDAIEGPFDGEESITLMADLDAGATGTMPSAVREPQPSLQLGLQDPVFSSQILIPQQQLMVHRPRDVGQDTCPLHKSPLCARRSARAPLIAPKNLVDDTRRGYAGMG